MAEILGVNLKTIADFMDAAQGNYRNALYISCLLYTSDAADE